MGAVQPFLRMCVRFLLAYTRHISDLSLSLFVSFACFSSAPAPFLSLPSPSTACLAVPPLCHRSLPTDVNTSTKYVEFFDNKYNTRANTYLGGAYQQVTSGLAETDPTTC